MAEGKYDGNIRDTKQDSRLTYLALWKEYEGVAMHFNELLIRLRTQALGGVAAISAITGFLSATKETETVSALTSMRLLETVFLVLAVFWVALFCLDFFYYRVLLNGAVEAILDLEKETGINLSTKIDQRLGYWKQDSKDNPAVKTFKWLWRMAGQILFYGIVLGILLWLYVRAGDMANRVDRDAAKKQAVAQVAKSLTPTVTPAKIGP